MIFSNKEFTMISVIEIIIAIITTILLVLILLAWWKPKYQSKITAFKWFHLSILFFDGYLLVDKLGHLLTIFIKAIDHRYRYLAIDYFLLGCDAFITIGLIISTGIFAKWVVKFYHHTPILENPDDDTLQILRVIAKSFRWLLILYVCKDIILNVLCAFLQLFMNIHYGLKGASYMTITFAFMLLLFTTFKIFIEMYKIALYQNKKGDINEM